MNPTPDALRREPLSRVLRALALGETSSEALVGACLDAIGADAAGLNAWSHVAGDDALREAAASDRRRADGAALGRLDGVPISVKDSFEVAGMPTGMGLPATRECAQSDATAVSRLRGAGAIVLGKSSMDPLGFGSLGRNACTGDVGNPTFPGRASGGSSAGAAASVAAGHAVAALAADALGSARIPAAFCGLVGFRPTFGEISRTGLAATLRRVDCPALVTRTVHDAAQLLRVLAGYDARDASSRARRVPLALPDWDPASLRVGRIGDLEALGASTAIIAGFDAALRAAGATLGHAEPVSLDLAALDVSQSRAAALLLMEAEILAAHETRLPAAPTALIERLEFARQRSAVDAMRAQNRLDRHTVAVRALFERFDVLVLPTTPCVAPEADQPEPRNLADFTALASLAGCPALSLPLPGGAGLQLVGPRGSDLRLLELGGIVHAVIEAGLHEST